MILQMIYIYKGGLSQRPKWNFFVFRCLFSWQWEMLFAPAHRHRHVEIHAYLGLWGPEPRFWLVIASFLTENDEKQSILSSCLNLDRQASGWERQSCMLFLELFNRCDPYAFIERSGFMSIPSAKDAPQVATLSFGSLTMWFGFLHVKKPSSSGNWAF